MPKRRATWKRKRNGTLSTRVTITWLIASVSFFIIAGMVIGNSISNG